MREAEKSIEEEARRLKEEMRLKEEEVMAKERQVALKQESLRQQEEELKKFEEEKESLLAAQEEVAREKAQADEELQRLEEERRSLSEIKAQTVAEKEELEAEHAKIEEEKAQLEAAKKVAEELSKRLEEEKQALEEERQAQAESRRKEEELRQQEEEMRRLEAQKKAKEEAQRQAEEEAQRRAEEEESARQEQARQLKEETERKAEEERLAKEEAQKKAQEESARKAEEEKKAQEEAARKAEEEKKAQEEEAKKTREESGRKIEELKKAQEAKRLSEEEKARQQEAEKWARLAEEERRKAEAMQKAAQESVEALKAQIKPQQAAVPAGTPSEGQCSGAILFKAAEYLIGGSSAVAEVIRTRTGRQKNELATFIEGLTFMPFFEQASAGGELVEACSLISKKISPQALQQFLSELQADRSLGTDIVQTLVSALQEVRCVKVSLGDGNSFYLDGQMHTVWSSQHIPYDFSSSFYNVKNYINQYFFQNVPFVLFMAPGYDTPSKEFFSFLAGLDAKGNNISKLVLNGSKFEELETISLEQSKKRFYIFSFWPWQFSEHRKVNKLGEFKPLHFAPLNKDIYVAEVELVLDQPATGQSLTLRGCAFKLTPTDKARQIILSNIPVEVMGTEELANAYLTHWPNLEEAFQDYSRKIELFTYTVDSQRYFSAENLTLKKSAGVEIRSVFADYLAALDSYVRWHFLPTGYEDKEFGMVKERFYDLPASLQRQQDNSTVTFQPPSGYAYQKELEYLCRRVNEREIVLNDGSRLWLSA